MPTVATRALLVAYNWDTSSFRYKKIAKFVDAFFSRIDEFHRGARHPKWKEINLAAEIPGWTRFRAASEWIAAHHNVAESSQQEGSAELKAAFEHFIANYAASDHKALSPSEREIQFTRFMQYLKTQKKDGAKSSSNFQRRPD